jgi:hypothetical protein
MERCSQSVLVLRQQHNLGGGGAVAAVLGNDPLTWLVDLHCGVQVRIVLSVYVVA